MDRQPADGAVFAVRSCWRTFSNWRSYLPPVRKAAFEGHDLACTGAANLVIQFGKTKGARNPAPACRLAERKLA